MKFKRIYVEITSSCNLTCSFCQETKRPKRFMSVSEFGRVMEQIKPYTNYIYLHVKGEPLLHPNLEDILKICRDAGITVNLTTNGTLLKAKSNVLIKYPVHQINISFHSAEDNDCICMDDYVRDVFSSCEELLKKTDTEISIRLWNNSNEPKIFGQNNIRVKDRLHINLQKTFEWPDIANVYHNDRGFCQGLRTHIAILSDGQVVPCCLDGNACMVLGNIFEQNLSEILVGERARRFVEGFNKKMAVEELCAHCSYKERFRHKM